MKRSTPRRVLVSTVPFGEIDPKPIELLEQARIEYLVNPLGRRFKPNELLELIPEFEVLIAGTESITDEVLAQAERLRLIARVGVGLDSVDLLAARRRNILVSYTPEAPAPAVAELTVGLMLDTLRRVSEADRILRAGNWKRLMGRRLAESTVGIVGLGRIGRRVVSLLRGFAPRIIAFDTCFDYAFASEQGVAFVELDELYRAADVISLHVPLSVSTRNLIGAPEFELMKSHAVVINTSRGGVVNERDLADALKRGRIAAAAVDVFEEEPYTGELTALANCLVTAHMGSMSRDCRARMEREATADAIRFLKNEPLRQVVPEEEYALRAAGIAAPTR